MLQERWQWLFGDFRIEWAWIFFFSFLPNFVLINASLLNLSDTHLCYRYVRECHLPPYEIKYWGLNIYLLSHTCFSFMICYEVVLAFIASPVLPLFKLVFTLVFFSWISNELLHGGYTYVCFNNLAFFHMLKRAPIASIEVVLRNYS